MHSHSHSPAFAHPRCLRRWRFLGARLGAADHVLRRLRRAPRGPGGQHQGAGFFHLVETPAKNNLEKVLNMSSSQRFPFKTNRERKKQNILKQMQVACSRNGATFGLPLNPPKCSSMISKKRLELSRVPWFQTPAIRRRGLPAMSPFGLVCFVKENLRFIVCLYTCYNTI